MLRHALLAIAFGLLLAGCGKEAIVTEAANEGILLDVGPLTYQVQISRYMNPNDPEDRAYLEGLPEGTGDPGRDAVYFGVFMRVKNYSDATHTPATQFEITDTLDNSYGPIPQSSTNNFVYQAVPIPPAGVLPEPESAAANGPVQGSLILFRIKTESLQNRPLDLHITQGQDEAVVELDL